MLRYDRIRPTYRSLLILVLLMAAFQPIPAIQAAEKAGTPYSLNAIDGVLDIPQASPQITVDGDCAQNEYSSAIVKSFTDGNGSPAKVYLIATIDHLYICMVAQPGSAQNRFARIYLDPSGDGGNTIYATKSDFAFQVGIPGKTMNAFKGNDSPNGWTATSGLDGYWTGSSTANASSDSVEYSFNLKSIGFGQQCSLFGLSVFHHWFAGVGDDYHWLDSSIFDQPRTWQLARIASANCPSGEIAYIFRGNTLNAVSFYNLLTLAGYGVDLIPLNTITALSNFSTYQLIIIADDSGNLDAWGSPLPVSLSTEQVNAIKSPNIPILGLGEGGYAFFGKLALFIGWPQGWHGPQMTMSNSTSDTTGLFTTPSALPDPLNYLIDPANSVGIYFNPLIPYPADVIPVGMEEPPDDHATLIVEGCRTLWGNSGNPLQMTADGTTLFLRTVAYTLSRKCGNPSTPPGGCITLKKTASLPDGTPLADGATVSPGSVITYTLEYLLSGDKACNNPSNAKLVDVIPANTTYVPHSSTDDISPGPDGAMSWLIFQSAVAQKKTFDVVVADTACNGTQAITNTAMLLASGNTPITSGLTNPVSCIDQPVVFPNTGPYYAEDELTVEPYPLSVGTMSEVRIRLNNASLVSQTVTVAFQRSRLGIGMPFSTFDTQTTTIPASGSAILRANYSPTQAGLACFQVTVTGSGLPAAMKTQSCIDNMEDFSLNASDSLTIPVQNPTSSAGDINLVVDNTCPGWSATIADPVLLAVGANRSDHRTTSLNVTRPTPATLRTGCHIDVQAWLNGALIGGIRKVDIPPVHLPTNVTPPWEEREIVFSPDPPVLGATNQLCVMLGNPLASSRTVTVEFDEADFGAGIGFTPIGTQDFTLPSHSYNRYCIPWTPAVTGTNHRCLLVRLRQADYPEMVSQRNVDVVRIMPVDVGSISIPITIRNPDLVPHLLSFDIQVAGVIPYWQPVIEDNLGQPAPSTLAAGGTLNLLLHFHPNPALAGLHLVPSDYWYGGVSQVSVGVLLDDVEMSGFTVLLETQHVFLSSVRR